MEERRKREIQRIQQSGWIISQLTTDFVFITDGDDRQKLKWEDVESFLKQTEGSVRT